MRGIWATDGWPRIITAFAVDHYEILHRTGAKGVPGLRVLDHAQGRPIHFFSSGLNDIAVQSKAFTARRHGQAAVQD
jgi:hypothetical protein